MNRGALSGTTVGQKGGCRRPCHQGCRIGLSLAPRPCKRDAGRPILPGTRRSCFQTNPRCGISTWRNFIGPDGAWHALTARSWRRPLQCGGTCRSTATERGPRQRKTRRRGHSFDASMLAGKRRSCRSCVRKKRDRSSVSADRSALLTGLPAARARNSDKRLGSSREFVSRLATQTHVYP